MIKKGDFVELDYVAKIKGTDIVFALTREQKAKELGLYNPNVKYGPVVICIGEKNLLSGLDEALIGRDVGSFEFDISAKDGFGLKNPKLIKIVKKDIFTKQNIKAFVGLQVNIDGMIGIIRSVSGGRSIVDFNHPLSGRDLTYSVEVKRIVENKIQKAKSLLRFALFLDEDVYVIESTGAGLEIKTKVDIPKELADIFIEKYKRLVSKDDSIGFVVDKGNTTTKE